MRAVRYSYIIIGGGSAGCVLAARLSEDPANRVLLLEAGGGDRSPLIRIPIAVGKMLADRLFAWNHLSEPAKEVANRRIDFPTGKVIGGGSSINGMVYVRGHASDYDQWKDLGNPGWGYADVLPYFLKAEGHSSRSGPFHNQNGPLRVRRSESKNPLYSAFIQAGVEAGFPETDDFNGESQEGFGRYDFTIHKGRRWSVVRAYLDEARRRPNLHVVTEATATRILFKGTRAVGAEYVHGGQFIKAMADAEVILSAGTIRSPALLIRSGLGDSRAVAKLGVPLVAHRPEVGRNLQDHPQVMFSFGCSQPVTVYSITRIDRAAWMMLRAILLRSGPGTGVPIEAAAFTRTRPEVPSPDIEWILRLSIGLARLRLRYPGFRGGPLDREGFTIGAYLLRPESRGTITVASKDPFESPKIDLGYLTAENDIKAMLAAVAQVRKVASQPALEPYISEIIDPKPSVKSEDEILAWIRKSMWGGTSMAGTCRMGSDDAAVVDPELKVRGVEGLRVVDGSIMPRIVSGNTNAPIIMIAEKAAAMIRSQRTRVIEASALHEWSRSSSQPSGMSTYEGKLI